MAETIEQNQKIPFRQIRAVYNDDTIRVYQAYSHAIANAALMKGTFSSPPFKMDRMTWIKPSFLWMMYRCGWGEKDAGQERVLAIDISQSGFEWALEHSCLSHPSARRSLGEKWDEVKRSSPVRIQWDPERNLKLQPLAHRAIQIGLSREAVPLYVNEWIKNIDDVTELAREIHALVLQNAVAKAEALLPRERAYPVKSELESKLGMQKEPPEADQSALQ